MTQVLDIVRKTIDDNSLLSGGEVLVVGVSGGPDSLCLLHLLCRLRADYDLSLHVAHLHHGLRGSEADADADFVSRLAADWRLPSTVERADVPALARQHRLAVEEAARRARYAFLVRVAHTSGARTVAVGHNADDQAETVLMHWLRGSGPAGLRGMLSLTQFAAYRLLEDVEPQPPGRAPGLRLIRPLLEVPRADVEAYCDFYGLEPRFDRSNLDTTYFRNWLRHEVLPLLARHNPNVREVIRRSARVIADDYDLLHSLLGETWPRIVLHESLLPPEAGMPSEASADEGSIVFDLAAWRALPTSLQRSTLREAIRRLRRSLRNINFLHVENALLVARDGTTGDQATLPRGLVLTVGYERLAIAAADAPWPLPDWPFLPPGGDQVPLLVPGNTPLPGSAWQLRAELVSPAALPGGWQENADPWRATLDERTVGGSPSLRTRLPGDRFQPLGMEGHTVKLADFFTNQKVPHPLRDRLPLLVGQGGIAWVCGQRPDHRARVTAGTETVLVLAFEKEER